jgi:hypothetical protein
MSPVTAYGESLALVARPQSPEPGFHHRESERGCRIEAQPVLSDPAASPSVVGFLLAQFMGPSQGIWVSVTGVVGYIAGATTNAML